MSSFSDDSFHLIAWKLMETINLKLFFFFFLEKGILAHGLIGTYILNKRLHNSAYSKFSLSIFSLHNQLFFTLHSAIIVLMLDNDKTNTYGI
jgi:hypothetical protein